MSWQFSPYAIVLFFSASVAALVASMAWQRHTKLSKYFALLILALAVWSLADGLEAAVVEMPAKILFGKLSYLGVCSVPPLFLTVVLVYSNREIWLTRWNIVALWTIPIVTMGLVAVNEWHGLIWSDFAFVPGSDERILIYHRGPFFWVQTAYSYIVILSATVLLIRVALRSSGLYKFQAWAIILAALTPWAANILYLLRWGPFPGRNLTQVSFLLSGLLLAWSITRLKVLDLTPIARTKILDTIPDAIIVVDISGKIIDLNPAACNLIGVSSQAAIGQPAAEILTKWPYLAQRLVSVEQLQDTTLNNTFQDDNLNWYTLTPSRLQDDHNRVIGWVFLLRNINEQRNAEKQAARLATVIEQAQETILITDLDGNITYANPFFEKISGFKVAEALGKNPRILQSGRQDKSFYAKLWQSISHGDAWTGNFINKRKDGGLYHEAATIFPIKDGDDNTINYAAVKRDITSQVEADLALRNLNEKLESLHEISLELSRTKSFDEMTSLAVMLGHAHLQFDRIGIWFMDLENPELLCGSIGIDENGKIRDEREQKVSINADPIFNLLLEETQRFFYEADWDLRNHLGQVIGIGEVAASALWDGRKIIGYISIDNLISQKPISSNQRELLVLFAQIIGNLASRQRSEENTKESERQYRLLANNATDVIWTMDFSGRFTYVSPSVEQLRGFAPTEVLQQSLEEVLTLESALLTRAALANFEQTTQEGDTIYPITLELEQKCKDSTTVLTESTISLVFDADQQGFILLGVTRDITERKKSEQEIQRYARYQTLLNDITQVAIRQTDFNLMLQTLADMMGDLVNADGCYITLWDEKNQTVIPAAAYGPMRDSYRTSIVPQPGEPTLTQSVLDHGEVLVISDVFNTPYLSPRIASAFPARSGLALPLIANNQKLGAALIASNYLREYSQAEIEISRQAAQQIALAILKARLFEEAQQRAKEADTLRLASAAIVTTLDQDQTFKRILEELNQVVPYDSASVLLIRDTEMEIVDARGFKNSDQILNLRFAVTDETPNKVVFDTKQPYILEDAQTEYAAFLKAPHDHIRGWMGIPLIVREQLIGMLTLDSETPGKFNQDHARLASAFADQVAIALENARLFEETRRLAITDPLTELYNRRHFMDVARREFDRSQRYKTPLSIIMLDVDYFKIINDTYGHLVGDQVLQTAAFICRKNLRSIDIIGRFGGEEFVILLPETALLDCREIEQNRNGLESLPARIVADRLRTTLAGKILAIGENSISITISLGVAEYTPTDKSIENVIDNADQALLEAKSQGRNRVVIWNPEEKLA